MNLAIFNMIFPLLLVENLQKHSILEILISNLPILQLICFLRLVKVSVLSGSLTSACPTSFGLFACLDFGPCPFDFFSPCLGCFRLCSLTRFHHFDEIQPTKERLVPRIQRNDVTIVQSVQKHEHDRICHFVGINCGPGFFSGTALRSSAHHTSVFCPQLCSPPPLVLFA